MKFSKKGYLRNSPDVNKPQNIIKGGNITMKGVDFKVHGVDNNGYAKVMTPPHDYYFPNAKYVTETPIKNKEMNGPFKMKPGRSPFPKTGKGLPKDMTNPIMQRIDVRTGKPTIEREESGDVFEGKTITTKTTTPRTVITTPEGDEAYAKLSPEGKKAQDAKFRELKDVKEVKLKTSGLVKPKTSGPSADISKSIKREKERIDPIERIEAFEQRSGTRGHLGVDVDRDFSGTGKYYNRPASAGMDFVDRAKKGFGGAMGYEVRGVRKSGKKVDLGLSKNVGSFGDFLKSKRTNERSGN
jgi:hypothetical protein